MTAPVASFAEYLLVPAFMLGAVEQIRHPGGMREVLRAAGLPRPAARTAEICGTAFEIMLVAVLISGLAPRFALGAAVWFLALGILAQVVGAVRERPRPCDCYGLLSGRSLVTSAARNFALAAVALTGFLVSDTWSLEPHRPGSASLAGLASGFLGLLTITLIEETDAFWRTASADRARRSSLAERMRATAVAPGAPGVGEAVSVPEAAGS